MIKITQAVVTVDNEMKEVLEKVANEAISTYENGARVFIDGPYKYDLEKIIASKGYEIVHFTQGTAFDKKKK